MEGEVGQADYLRLSVLRHRLLASSRGTLHILHPSERPIKVDIDISSSKQELLIWLTLNSTMVYHEQIQVVTD